MSKQTIQEILNLINFPLTVTPQEEFSDEAAESYNIDGFILSKELRSSPRVIERKEYRWVLTAPIVTYDYECGYDYDYQELYDGHSLTDAILEITNQINKQKIRSHFESKMCEEEDITPP